MNQKAVISLIFLLVIFTTFAQAQESRMRLQVLRHNHLNREYIFNSKDQSKTYLTYLGELSTKKGARYKIMNSVWVWGSAHRATSRILVYSEHNQYLGNYPLTTVDDLPSYISNNKLVFKNKGNADCDVKSITYVDFVNGIPREFFRRCSGDEGDSYQFDKH